MQTTPKAEVAHAAEKTALAILGTTITLADVATIVTILVGLATFIFVTLQGIFLLRKWWLLEKSRRSPKWE